MSSDRMPPAPEELEGQELEIDFISMLAQAQKAVSTGAIERFAGFVGNWAGLDPTVLDKVDRDEGVDQYAEMLGIPPGMVRGDDEVESIRAQRQQELQRQQQAENAATATQAVKQGAEAARLLSEADNPRGPAPTDILTRTGLA